MRVIFAIHGIRGNSNGFLRHGHDLRCYEKPFKDLKIYNHQQKDLEHGDYFKGTKFFKEWLDIINERATYGVKRT